MAGLLLLSAGAVRAEGDSLLVLSWNLENFFDTRDDSLHVGNGDFTPRGDRHWTRRRFAAKCDAVAKAILWTGSRYGRLPDVIGLEEVENAYVLRRLLRETALAKLDYRYVHYDSPDPRGIDVALLYRTSVFEERSSRPVRVGGDSLRTRDILLVQLTRVAAGLRASDFSFIVNHFPSKYGGARASAPRRQAAVERLGMLVDSLAGAGETRIVAMGDFNDTPDRFGALPLVDVASPLQERGEGSIRYDGVWSLIDLFFVSEALAGKAVMEPVRIPFLMTRDGAHAGEKPLRTYAGPRYLGGVSDHLPVVLRLSEL